VRNHILGEYGGPQTQDVWEEGGYEGGPHLDEYGRPAWRWAGDVEDRVAGAVQRVVQKVRRSHPGSR